MFLATTALTEFWNRDEEILFLGPWCLRQSRQSEWKDLRYRVVSSPWADPAKFSAVCETLNIRYERILSHLVDYLNEIHEVSFSCRYWRILVGPWLLRYLHVAFDRYAHLEAALSQYATAHTLLLDPASFRVPADFCEAEEFMLNDPYNLQIISQQLKALGHCFPNKFLAPQWLEFGMNDDRPRRNLPEVIKAAAWRGVRLAGEIAGRIQRKPWAAICEFYSTPRDTWSLAWRTRFRAIPIETKKGWPFEASLPLFDERRQGLRSIPAADEFERVFCASLPWGMPTLYLESYLRARGEALSDVHAKACTLVSAVGWAHNERFKFVAAERSERGARIMAVQHGGGYGMFQHLPLEAHESQIADSYGVWGWASDSPNLCQNLPHPRVVSAGTRRSSRKDWRQVSEILLVETGHPRYLHRFDSTSVASHFDEYCEWQFRFLAALAYCLRSNLTIRSYPGEHGQMMRDRINARFPGTRWDTGASFQKRVQTVRIVVIDNAYTTFLETLAGNVPTLLFWDPRRWPLRPQAEPYVRALREAGILYDCPETAAIALESAYDHVHDWWYAPVVQEARKHFVDRYALVRLNWHERWAQAIKEQITLSQKPGF